MEGKAEYISIKTIKFKYQQRYCVTKMQPRGQRIYFWSDKKRLLLSKAKRL